MIIWNQPSPARRAAVEAVRHVLEFEVVRRAQVAGELVDLGHEVADEAGHRDAAVLELRDAAALEVLGRALGREAERVEEAERRQHAARVERLDDRPLGRGAAGATSALAPAASARTVFIVAICARGGGPAPSRSRPGEGRALDRRCVRGRSRGDGAARPRRLRATIDRHRAPIGAVKDLWGERGATHARGPTATITNARGQRATPAAVAQRSTATFGGRWLNYVAVGADLAQRWRARV